MISDEDLERLVVKARDLVRRSGPAMEPWDSPVWRERSATDQLPPAIRLGQLLYRDPAAPEQALSLPAILHAAPTPQHLFIERAGDTLERAAALLNSAILRLALLAPDPSTVRIALINPSDNQQLHVPMLQCKMARLMDPDNVGPWLTGHDEDTCFIVIYDIVTAEWHENSYKGFSEQTLDFINNKLVAKNDRPHQFLISFTPDGIDDSLSVTRKRLKERAQFIQMERGTQQAQNLLPAALFSPLDYVFSPDECPPLNDIGQLLRRAGIARA